MSDDEPKNQKPEQQIQPPMIDDPFDAAREMHTRELIHLKNRKNRIAWLKNKFRDYPN